MAENPANGITWLLELRKQDADWLGDIRHWSHLKTATEDGRIWVTGFSSNEISDVSVRSIPVKKVWYQKDHLLFAQGSIVPSRKAPALLWTPIERGLPLQLPAWNHNLFGVAGHIPLSLVASSEEREPAALIVGLMQLHDFIEGASVVRLQPLRWIILNEKDALIIGTPLLPLPGKVYWADGDFLIPAGYDLEWRQLTTQFQSIMALQDEPSFLLLHASAAFSKIPKISFRQLSIGSFRQSTSLILPV